MGWDCGEWQWVAQVNQSTSSVDTPYQPHAVTEPGEARDMAARAEGLRGRPGVRPL